MADDENDANENAQSEPQGLNFKIRKADNVKSPFLEDIVGSPEFKKDLEDITSSIIHPEPYMLYGLRPEKSFLFYGPPGTGKTYATEAIANEVALSGEKVLWCPYDTGTYGTAYINKGARILNKYFELSQLVVESNIATKRFLVFDEADELLGKRHNERFNTKEDDKVLSELMKNLQKINNSSATDTYIFFLTNFKDAMDSAAIRAGRVDCQIEFPMPNAQALEAAYKYEINKVNTAAGWNVIRAKRIPELSRLSVGFTYADVHTLVEGAVRSKVREFLTKTQSTPGIIEKAPHITTQDMLNRVEVHRQQHYANNEYFGIKKAHIGFK